MEDQDVEADDEDEDEEEDEEEDIQMVSGPNPFFFLIRSHRSGNAHFNHPLFFSQ
jgi:hypothetical protein